MTDLDAIAAKVRQDIEGIGPALVGGQVYLDLYDEVTQLRAERDRLRAALSQIAHGRERIDISYREFLDEFVRPLARAALKGDTK